MGNRILESFFLSGEGAIPVKLEGQIIGYYEESLKEKVEEIFLKLDFGNQKFKKYIIEDLRKGDLIPFYTSSTWMSDIFDNFVRIFNIFQPTILAFCYNKKIYLCITNLRNFFGEVEDEAFKEIIRHEYMHKFASTKNLYNIKYIREVLETWFYMFFYYYFEKELTREEILKIVPYFTDINNENKYVRGLSRYIKMKYKIISSIDFLIKHENREIVRKYRRLLNFILNNLSENYDFYDAVQESAVKAYSSMDCKNINSFVYQEFVFPSEILCILAGFEESYFKRFIQVII